MILFLFPVLLYSSSPSASFIISYCEFQYFIVISAFEISTGFIFVIEFEFNQSTVVVLVSAPLSFTLLLF